MCANDRFNYGDLLFPFIIRHYLDDEVDEVVVCSTTESDLSLRGALPTKPFSVLQKMSPYRKNYLIIGGGECIFVDWQPILDFIKADLVYEKSSFPTKYPFTIGKRELPNLEGMIYAVPRMSLYVKKSAEIVSIVLDFVAEDDIHVYSIDELFVNLTPYLKMYNSTPKQLVRKIQKAIYDKTKLVTTAGIGDNMLMAKLALDLDAKNKPQLINYRKIIWN